MSPVPAAARRQHILDLNFMSVLHGVRVFLPLMRAQRDQEAHIVNTASITGVAHGSRPYGVTKAAVIALSEAAQQELMSAGVEHVTVSSLIPAEVSTRIRFLGRRIIGAVSTFYSLPRPAWC